MDTKSSVNVPLTRGKRIGLAIFGLIIVVLMAGPPDLALNMLFTAWSDTLDGGAHRFHLFARGVGTAVTVGAAIVLIVKPTWLIGSLQKLVGTGIAFLFAGIVSLEVWPPVVVYPIFALITLGFVFLMFRRQFPWRQMMRPPVSKPLLAVAAVIAIPLMFWGFGEASLQRSSETLHGDLGHWGSGMAAAMLVVLMMLFAAQRLPGWRVPAWGAAFTLLMLGIASVYWPNQASSFGTTWGVLAIIGGVAFLGVAELEGRAFAQASEPHPAQTAQ